MRYLVAILIGRFVRAGVRVFRPGGGSALPGVVLKTIAPGLLASTLNRFEHGLVIITGSAGKSTTTKMTVAILRAHGHSVFTNPSTANIEQGFYSSIIEKSNLFGRVPGDIAVLEMDEAHAAVIVKTVNPRFATILNVLEDQLDRFIDPSYVRRDLGTVAAAATEGVILNADDQNILWMLSESGAQGVSWFGLSDDVLRSARKGLGTAPTYLTEIERPESQTTGVSLTDRSLTVRFNTGVELAVSLPARGLHFAVDTLAALETSKRLLQDAFDAQLAAKVLDGLPPVFARGEMKAVNGERVEFILVQNPASFQLNLDNLTTNPDQILFAIGSDVHDPSWLWTVDLSKLSHADVVTGYNWAEAALLLAYREIPVASVIADLDEALASFFALPRPARGHKTVIFSADAMRRTRRALRFTDPEDVGR
ncbi:MAG: hypothetical protein RLZ28_87 [Actinomycetota bacterium]